MKDRITGWTRSWARAAGVQLWFAEEAVSTNTFAREDFGEVAKSKLAPILYLAGHQTGGRGRGANAWNDAPGALLSSWSFHMTKPPQPVFAPLAGLAVYRAAMKTWPRLPWSLKAPNDIYIGAKKVAGLLVESVERGDERRAIVGLGLNVLAAPAVVPAATSLAAELGDEGAITEQDWGRFLRSLLVNFMATLPAGVKTELSKPDAEALAEALNRRPNLESRIEKVGAEGELHTANGVIPWQSL